MAARRRTASRRPPTPTRKRAAIQAKAIAVVRHGQAPATKAVPGTDMPPAQGAPPATPPVQTRRDQRAVAPWPLIDRYPTIIGRALNESYVGLVFRTALTGYRQQYVDLLEELLDHDAHLASVLGKRIASTANGRLTIKPYDVPEHDPDYKLARACAEMVQREVARIPRLTEALASLLWGIYYGVTAAEIFWTRDTDGSWHVDRLDMVHSRRLAYPDMQSWDLFIWDQGQVLGWEAFGESPTNRATYGTRIADWPGKFMVYAPRLRGDYPTREGLGRNTTTWALFKRAGVRGCMGYLERYAEGYTDVEYTTTDGGKPRRATDDDIDDAHAFAAAGFGPGNTRIVHPDSVTVTAKGYEGTGTAKITYEEFVHLCNDEISKVVLGGTLGTEVGKGGGNRALGEVQERAEVDFEQYDATTLCEAFRHDVVYWLVRLNMPEALHLVPHVLVDVDREPDAKTLIANATGITKIGGRVDLDRLSDDTGIPLIPNEPGEDGEIKPRGSFLSDVTDPSAVLPDLLSADAKAQQEADAEAQHAIDLAKAKQAPAAPGAQQQPPPPARAASKVQPKAGKPGKGGKGKGAKAGKATQAAYRARLSVTDRVQYDAVCLALKGRPDAEYARAVYEQLLDDYPAWACAWVLACSWALVEIPQDEIDKAHRDEWRASHDGTLQSYIDKIQEGVRKPAIAVKTPSNPLAVVVDGHHRELAHEALGRPLLAYLASVPVDHGPWLELHAMQKKGSSKGGSRLASYTSVYPGNAASFTPAGAPSLRVRLNARPDPSLRGASIVLVVDAAGRVLTVSRPEPPHEQAFPGGMVNPGETPDQAAARELHEETGLVVASNPDGTPQLEPILVTSSPTDGRVVYVYRALAWSGDAYAAEPATVVEWLEPGAFFAQATLYRDLVRELLARDEIHPAAAPTDAAAE